MVSSSAVSSLLLATATHSLVLNGRVASPVTSRSRGAIAQVAAPAAPVSDEVSEKEPLRVLICGAGVGGLALANCLQHADHETSVPVEYTVLERTTEFKRFGGPIQLASNAMQNFRAIDESLYDEIEAQVTWTGNRTNGIKDGIRDEWYAKFDLGTPAKVRNMPYTCVIDRPDLQETLLSRINHNVRNGAAISSYEYEKDGTVTAVLESGERVHGDVLIGADGIWSAVRAGMRGEPAKGAGSGVSYSGYTVFAGELTYNAASTPSDIGPDPACGYKVYIGPNQYFVITDIGGGRYQWYAFLARDEGSEASEPKPDGASPYLQKLFTGWSPEVIDILQATREDEIEQRDLYDRPPSVLKKWNDGRVALLGDAVHAMMPNLGQGGCQAIEDAAVLAEEIGATTHRSDLADALQRYRNRRLARSAAVQGLSRFASDIIIQGFDTPAKVYMKDGALQVENLNYAGVVTRLLQPILPIFFSVQFNFLYSGWRNERFALEPIRDFFLLAPAVLGTGLLVDGMLGGELLGGGEALGAIDGASEGSEGILATLQQLFESFSGMM